ncbi:uncharacterized protein LOC135120831 [Zophobas morio]|uniref:uncharacterized protein LOC135120831 n=1 Tax=Zophobas morio TaxID=2755281 RepID=UPI0030836770
MYMKDVTSLYNKFISRDAPQELNLTSKTLNHTTSGYQYLPQDTHKITTSLFSEIFRPAYDEIITLLTQNFFKDFIATPTVVNLLNQRGKHKSVVEYFETKKRPQSSIPQESASSSPGLGNTTTFFIKQ